MGEVPRKSTLGPAHDRAEARFDQSPIRQTRFFGVQSPSSRSLCGYITAVIWLRLEKQVMLVSEVLPMVFPMRCPSCNTVQQFATLLNEAELKIALKSDTPITAMHYTNNDGDHVVRVGSESRRKLEDALAESDRLAELMRAR